MYKDIVNKQRVSAANAPKFEGHMKIALYNAKTGKLEKKVEGKNIVTDAVADIFASNYFGLLSYQNILPIRNLFGGILCFQNALTANAGNYYPPLASSNPVTAHAGQTTYASADADSKRGLPNDIESGPVTNGYKFVWDFASTQGNGTIAALALTHKDFGDFYLNGGTNFEPIQNLDYPSGSAYIRNIVFWNDTNRVGYALEGSSTTLNLIEYKNIAAITGLGINEENLITRPTDSNVVATHAITMSRNWNVYMYLYRELAGEIHALYATGNTIERIIIDLSDYSTTRSDITVSGASLKTSQAPFDNYANVVQLDDDGYLYLQGSSETVCYKIDYLNVANVVQVTAPNVSKYNYPIVGIGHYGLLATGSNGIIVDGANAYQCGVNSENDYSNYLNRWRMPTRGGKSPVFYMTCQRRNTENCASPRLALCKMFLSTIKNLDSAVVKTSTQTMKITYTVLEVSSN